MTYSDEYFRIFGLAPRKGPIDIATMREMIHPEDREYVFRIAEDAIRSGESAECEHRILRPNGEIRIVHSRGDLKKNASGRPYEMFGESQDITDRTVAEQALKRRQFYLCEGERLAHMGSRASSDSGNSWSEDIELQAELKAERCRIPIIFITGGADIPLAVSAMKEGASDFLTKPVDGTSLLSSVERALQQDLANRREALEYERLVARYLCLTPRERELLPLLASGLLNKQVAFELGITEWTVQLHRGHIMRKMQANSFAGLVMMADKLSPNHQQLQFGVPS